MRIIAYSDADHGNDILANRRSVSGVMLCLGGGPIIFASRKQSAIGQSSTEVEYVAPNEAVEEIKWLDQLLDELSVTHEKPLLLIDNQSTIARIKNFETKRRSKHIELKDHYIRDRFENHSFNLQQIDSSRQLSDLLTKPLPGPRIKTLLDLYHG